MGTPLALLLSLFTAAALGGLIGLEREIRIQNEAGNASMAGLRTFAMLGILGFLGMYFFQRFQEFWFIPLFFVGALSFSLLSHCFLLSEKRGIGITSELSVLGSLGVGMLVAANEMFLAVSVSILFTALLALKTNLHSFAHKMSQSELLALLKFLIVSFVVLKVMPASWVDPWKLFDWRPQLVWLMVVFVTAIRLIGYFLAKFIGSNKSIVLSGLIGGIVSSTAVTTSLAQESKGQKQYAPFLLAILVAAAIMFLRVLLETSLLSPALFQKLSLPLFAMVGLSFGIAAFLAFMEKRHDKNLKSQLKIAQPFDLKAALIFGLFFIGTLFVVDTVQGASFSAAGNFGLLLTGAIAGLADVDAIILVMANTVQQGHIATGLAAQVVFLAVGVNALLKAAIILLFASRQLFLNFLWVLIIILSGGGIVFWLTTL